MPSSQTTARMPQDSGNSAISGEPVYHHRMQPDQENSQAKKADNFERGVGDVANHLGEADDVDVDLGVVVGVVQDLDIQLRPG